MIQANVTTNCGGFQVTGKDRKEIDGKIAYMLESGEYVQSVDVSPFYPDSISITLVMDGRRHVERFNHLSGLNVFLSKHKRRIYGILSIGHGFKDRGRRLNSVLTMHGIGYIRG